MPNSSCLWSTIRFRPSKHNNGWVLLGIPKKLHHLVVNSLVHIEVQILDSYDSGDFVSVLLEAPPQALLRLASAFPPPNSICPAGDPDSRGTTQNPSELLSVTPNI